MKPRIALTVVVALAWAWLLAGAGVGMEEMDMGGGHMMLMRPEWTWGHAALVFAMWVAMMVAMMLPGASPAIPGSAGLGTAIAFTLAYLAVWTRFSLATTLAQYALDRADLISDAMALRSEAAAGLLILGVGLYQLMPLKHACLRGCASVSGASGNPRPSAWASALLGFRYGATCLGCCWTLMVLLFVAGVMNVLWIAALALWVSAEKLLPWGARIARVAGAGLIAWGSVQLAIAVL